MTSCTNKVTLHYIFLKLSIYNLGLLWNFYLWYFLCNNTACLVFYFIISEICCFSCNGLLIKHLNKVLVKLVLVLINPYLYTRWSDEVLWLACLVPCQLQQQLTFSSKSWLYYLCWVIINQTGGSYCFI